MNFVTVDCGDYVEVSPQGILVNSDKIVATAGIELNQRPNQTVFTVPPIIFKLPKEVPKNMTADTLVLQVYQEAIDKFMVNFKEGFEKAKARNQTADFVTHEDNMDQEEAGAATDSMAMKELHSSLDNCAKGHCAACKL
ncbi:hypothetical protein OROMI_003014 [Orobanche minor]